MREGEILENGSGELICEKCGAIYELEDMEFTPTFVRTNKKDENGLCRRSENLMDGEWVELIHKDFEFDFKGEPTGHYARGRVVKWYDNEFCLVELFCNGKRYKVSKQIVAHHKY